MINQPGVYMVSFQSSVAPQSGQTYPLAADAQLQLNGSNVPGGVADAIFASNQANTSLSFTIPITVSKAPAKLQVVPGYSGSNFYNTSLTVQKIGTTGSSS